MRQRGRGPDEAADDLDQFGVAGEIREALEEGDERFAVWPENVRALQLFLACQTQWRYHAMGGVLGLDYAGVEAVLRLRGVRHRRRVFSDLQVMEAAALPLLNEQADGG